MKAFYSDHFVLPLPAGHRFPMAKYGLLRERLARELPQVVMLEAPRVSDGELALVHEPGYVASLEQGTISPEAMREIGFPWSAAMVERSRRSAGATVAAARMALQEGLAANLAGGTHHAYAGKGGGFCVFNDAAVATRLMQAEWGRRQRRALRVAIIDLDMHQGNGTAHIFQHDDSVFTLSARRISRSARKAATWMWHCPTAAKTILICRRWKRRSVSWSTASIPGW